MHDNNRIELTFIGSTYLIAVSSSNYLRRKYLQYTKEFACLDELNTFVYFQKEETGLKFSSNRELKTAWIEVDEKIHQELTHADMFE
jgi:hypothetical protein